MNFIAIAECNTVLGNERSHSGDVFDAVLLQVALIDTVKTLDVGISLVLEGKPVKLCRASLREAVLLGVIDSISN